jgi:hypothetical protein
MFLVDAEYFRIFGGLDGGADIFFADQAGFAEYLATTKVGDGDTGFVEYIDCSGDNDVKV